MSNGKKSKQTENEKKEKNDFIEGTIMKYYLTEQEMPQYMINFAGQMQEKYKHQFGMMITQFGVVAANLKLIKVEVKGSKLSKASKDKILNLINISMGGSDE